MMYCGKTADWISMLFGVMTGEWGRLIRVFYYYRFTAVWILSGTIRVSRYQKGKTRKVKPIWIYSYVYKQY